MCKWIKVGAAWFLRASPFYPFPAPARFCGKALMEEKCKTITFVPPWDINTDEAFVAGICIFLVWISKAVVWRIEEEATSLRRYFTIVLAIFLVAVAVSTHLKT